MNRTRHNRGPAPSHPRRLHMSRFFPNEDGYAPGDAANPVRVAVDDNILAMHPTAGVMRGGAVPLVGVVTIAAVLYLIEHRRILRAR